MKAKKGFVINGRQETLELFRIPALTIFKSYLIISSLNYRQKLRLVDKRNLMLQSFEWDSAKRKWEGRTSVSIPFWAISEFIRILSLHLFSKCREQTWVIGDNDLSRVVATSQDHHLTLTKQVRHVRTGEWNETKGVLIYDSQVTCLIDFLDLWRQTYAKDITASFKEYQKDLKLLGRPSL